MKRKDWLQWAVMIAVLVPTVPGNAQSSALQQEAACETLKPASAGGPLPTDPNVLVLRYFSYGSYEVAYRGKVLLLDAYYDNSRLPFEQKAGLKESDITRADAIFVGHTHVDHFIDAPAIAKRTGAPVFLGPQGVKYLQTEGVAEKQIRLVRGGETIKLNGLTVQTALGIHIPVAQADTSGYREFISKTDPLTEEQQKQVAAWMKQATPNVAQDYLDPDSDTIYHGTIIYALTFDNGYRLVFSDTAGVLSGGEHNLADSIHANGGKVGIAIIGYLEGGFSLPKALKTTVPRVKLWAPDIFLPSHFHNGDARILPEMPTAPLFEALRDAVPNTRPVSSLYSSPVCVNTKTNELFVGNYVR
jgi:Metallo-beta-lactamase superfamily